jgi:hypothetical protein
MDTVKNALIAFALLVGIAFIEPSGSSVDVWQKGKSMLRVTYDEHGRATNVCREGTWTLVVPFNENDPHTSAVNQPISK